MTSYSLLELWRFPIIFGVYLLRILIVLQGHIWPDIQNGINPSLACFYCSPHNGPYGILWWLISQPLRWNYPGEVAFIDLLVLVALRQKILFLPIYAFMSWLLWLQAPYDVPILWVTLAGFYKLPLVLLGPLAKLPFGAPLSVWNFILSKPYNINDVEYYAFMGVVFVSVVLYVKAYTRYPKVSNTLKHERRTETIS